MKPLLPLVLVVGALGACTSDRPPSAVAQLSSDPLPGSLPPPVAPRDGSAREASSAYYLGPRGDEWN